MKLSDYRADYYAFSTKTSEISRQLSFAGIALIWVFKPEGVEAIAIPVALLWPAALFVLCLGLDLLHATYGTFVWGVFSRYHEKRMKRGQTDPEKSLDSPSWFNWPTNAFFWGKVISVVTGYVLTLSYIWGLIREAKVLG